MATDNCELKYGVSEDKTILELATTSPVGQTLSVKLSAPQVEDLIKAVGVARAGMTPGVAADPKGEILTIGSLECRALPGPNGEKSLYLRHPAFGWIAWTMEPVQAKQIGYWLAADPAPATA